MALSSPYRSMPWTVSAAVASLLGELERHRQAVGAKLRELRKARGWNQEDAAHAVGVAVKTWQLWERGRTDPYDSNWRKIGEAFSVDPSEVRGTPPTPLGLGAPSPPPADFGHLARIEHKLDALMRYHIAAMPELAQELLSLLQAEADQQADEQGDAPEAEPPAEDPPTG